MYIPFEQLPGEARIWIYQASRPFAQGEIKVLLQRTKTFLEGWSAHGTPLQSSVTIMHHQFLVLAVDESFQAVTGCALDTSVQFMRELEQVFQINLLDRMQVAFREANGSVVVFPLSLVKTKIQQGFILETTPIFDNTITRKAELDNKWLTPARDSWVGKYFHKQYQEML